RHFGRDDQLRASGVPSAQEIAEQALAAAVTVDPGGVEEVAAERDRDLERAQRLVIVGARPPAHAPHAVADLRDLPPDPSERSIAHSASVQSFGNASILALG